MPLLSVLYFNKIPIIIIYGLKYEHIPGGMCVTGKDSDLSIIDLNGVWRMNTASGLGVTLNRHNFLTGGAAKRKSPDDNRNVFISIMFSVVAFLVLFIYCIEAFYIGNIVRGSLLLSMQLIVAGNYIFLRTTSRYRLSNKITVCMMAFLCFYLICSGGQDKTGPLWILVLPMLSLYVLGLRSGAVVHLISSVIFIVLLFVPGLPVVKVDYSIYFKTRLIGVFAMVSFMSFFYEYSRRRTQLQLQEMAEKFEFYAKTDELTGLMNRRDMLERLENEVARFKRSKDPFSIILSDIDHFKLVNDNYGHDCGDYVLKETAVIMKDALRKQDYVARWGGEEFLIFLPNTGPAGAAVVAETIRHSISEFRFDYQGHQFGITMSFGVCSPSDAAETAAFIKMADENLYCAKNNGRNLVITG